MTTLVTAALDPARLADLAERHKSPGRRRAEQLATVASCSVPDCGRSPARLLPRGWLCVELHLPPQPNPQPSRRPSPSESLDPPQYGDATTDPLGRDAPGWVKDERTRLPRRVTT